MTKRAGKNKRSPAALGRQTTARHGRSPQEQLKATGQPIQGELVPPKPEYTFVGSGKDAALVSQAIREGWQVPTEAKQRIVQALAEHTKRKDLSIGDAERIGRMMEKFDRLQIEASKLRMVAQMNGLEAQEVRKVSVADPNEQFIKAALKDCKSVEHAEWLLRVARSLAH
jgi:hypothetical protein